MLDTKWDLKLGLADSSQPHCSQKQAGQKGDEAEKANHKSPSQMESQKFKISYLPRMVEIKETMVKTRLLHFIYGSSVVTYYYPKQCKKLRMG